MSYVFQIISIILSALELVILLRCILSFVPYLNNGFTRFIFNISEPILRPCRQILYQFEFMRRLPVDLSPLLAFLLIGITERFVSMVYHLLLRLFWLIPWI